MSELSEARAEAARHRAAFVATAEALHAKATPLVDAAHDAVVAVDRAKQRSERLLDDAKRVVREPKTVSAVVGVVTAVASFRIFRHFFKRRPDGDDQ